MIRIVVDESVKQQLSLAAEPCAVVDAAGNKLGYFMPEADQSLYENLEVPFSDEELRLAGEEEGGRTLAEILADLEERR